MSNVVTVSNSDGRLFYICGVKTNNVWQSHMLQDDNTARLLEGDRVVCLFVELVVDKVKDMEDREQVSKAIRTSIMSKQYGNEDFLTQLICEACGRSLTQLICEACGRSLTQLICKACGRSLTQLICEACGRSLTQLICEACGRSLTQLICEACGRSPTQLICEACGRSLTQLICKACGRSLTQLICKACGRSLTQLICKACGRSLTQLICKACGRSLTQLICKACGRSQSLCLVTHVCLWTSLCCFIWDFPSLSIWWWPLKMTVMVRQVNTGHGRLVVIYNNALKSKKSSNYCILSVSTWQLCFLWSLVDHESKFPPNNGLLDHVSFVKQGKLYRYCLLGLWA